MPRVVIRDIADTVKSSLTPMAFPDERFNYYSIPDLDEHGVAGLVEGREIASAKNLVENGTVLVSKLNPRIKRVWQVEGGSSRRSLASTEFIALRPRRTEDASYLFYALHLDEIWTHLRSCAIGSTNSHTRCKPKDLEELSIPYAEPADRPVIARILRTIDALIAQTEVLIEKQRRIKHGMLHDFFSRGVDANGQLRPPQNEAPELYKETKLGWVPKEWEVVRLGSLTHEHKQGYFTNQRYTEEGIRLIRITDLKNPEVDFSEMPKLQIPQRDFEQFKVLRGDFLFARSGAIGRYGIYESEERSIFGSYIIRFRFTKELMNDFFGYFYEGFVVPLQIPRIVQGSSNININAENIKALHTVKPPVHEQSEIARRMKTLDGVIHAEIDNCTKLQSLKSGLMQDLLTGRVPLDHLVESMNEKVATVANPN